MTDRDPAVTAPAFRHHVCVTRTTLATWDADRFRTLYRARGWTLQQVSARSGIPYSAVRSYSAGGARPTAERLVQLARALEVPTTDLAPLSRTPTLHELRWHAGLTIAQTAERAGYTLSHTSAVLSGTVPVMEPARWAQAFGTTQRAVKQAWLAARSQLTEDEQ
ncbi:helix-turn-helix domain-containing protein [Kitasatospora sp. NBC_01302]|uniref:helix-turn-helix domain-containing protein n=1 Tax=Kitasatospora sp. NBC_01302 TaxID=2903575 RepID=UPI002E158FD0|nr:helix-turn-helix domain-containing protein [Kitasatospora sp. NBC_01302]